jgi:hypothetical protein
LLSRRHGTALATLRLVQPVERRRASGFCVVALEQARARVLAMPVSASRPGVLEQIEEASHVEALQPKEQRFFKHFAGEPRRRLRRVYVRRFVEHVLADASRTWRCFDASTIIVAADEWMLGLMRPVLQRYLRGDGRHIAIEHHAEMTGLSASAVHRVLADAGLLPPPPNGGTRQGEDPRLGGEEPASGPGLH